MPPRIPVALTVAGSDSGGGAGIVADLMTFAAHHVFGTVAVAAVTAQNTREIRSAEACKPTLLSAQIQAVFADLRPDSVKVGMLGTGRNVAAAASALERCRARNIVVDPVLTSTSGAPLLEKSGIATLKKRLLPLAALATPNLPEAEVLAGFPIRTLADRRLAAEAIADAGPEAVLVKGGHGEGNEIVDLLFDGKHHFEFRNFRVDTRATHGTGCTLSSAIAANMARGACLTDAVKNGIEYLRRCLKRGLYPGEGFGSPGHF